MYKYLVRTSQIIKRSSNRKTNQLMLDVEMINVYCQNSMEHTNALCGQNVEFLKSYWTV